MTTMLDSPTIPWVQMYLYPLLTTLGLWGLLTLGVWWLNRQKRSLSRVVLIGMVGVLILAHHHLWLVRNDVSAWGAYRAFIACMLIWTWHELAFYSGVLTGPWRAPCPPDVAGWQRLRYALGTHLYHIVAVGIDIIVVWWMHRHAVNLIGPLTFSLFWLLQLSAKLNVLFGVRNLQVMWLPDDLRYLGSFWVQRPFNAFFIPSVMAIMLLAAFLWWQAIRIAPDERAIGMSLLAGMVTLGLLEHWLLVLPAGKHKEQPVQQKAQKASH